MNPIARFHVPYVHNKAAQLFFFAMILENPADVPVVWPIDLYCGVLAARIIAKMPARITEGIVGHESMIARSSSSATTGGHNVTDAFTALGCAV